MVTLAEIRDAVVDETQSVSSILRKVKIFTYKLSNEDFKNWVEWELNGYPDDVNLPNYRLLDSHIRADGFVGFSQFTNEPVPLPQEFADKLSRVALRDGISKIERIHIGNPQNGKYIGLAWSPNMIARFNELVSNYQYAAVYNAVSPSSIFNILETVRHRLLSFVLEYEDDNHNNPPIIMSKEQLMQLEQLLKNFLPTIHNNGGVIQMSIFDQKHQLVQGNQYNAARDINFGEVKTREDFVSELSDLLKQVESVQSTEDKPVIIQEIKSNLEEAIVEANKENPDKGKIRKFLEKASEFAKITTAFAGTITIFHKAAEALQSLPF